MADNECRPSSPKQMQPIFQSSNSANENGKSQPNLSYVQRNCPKESEDDFEAIELPRPKRKRLAEKDLMVLNDDCLLEMFKHLTTIDLRNVSQVNCRLNSLMKYFFQHKYKIKIKPGTHFDFKTLDNRQMDFHEAQLYLKIFGHEIRSLNVPCSQIGIRFRRAVNLLVSYCNVSTLTFTDFEYPIIETGGKESFFRQLNELRIVNLKVTDRDMGSLVRALPTLKRLSVVNGYGTSTRFFKYLPDLSILEEFEFKKYNTTKKKDFYYDLRHFLALKKLKVLKFGYTNRTKFSALRLLNGFVQNGIAIEHLELWSARGDNETLSSIANLKTIKILKLNNVIGLRKAHIVHIAKELELLQELHIRTDAAISRYAINEIVNVADRLSCLKIDATGSIIGPDSYNELLTTVQNRKEANKLELTIYGDGKLRLELDQPSEEQWLTVKQLKRKRHHLFDDLTNADRPRVVHFDLKPLKNQSPYYELLRKLWENIFI